MVFAMATMPFCVAPNPHPLIVICIPGSMLIAEMLVIVGALIVNGRLFLDLPF
jgi:hypothetical protein